MLTKQLWPTSGDSLGLKGFLLIFSLIACGESAKFGGSGGETQADAISVKVPPSKGYRSLTWYWQCESNPLDIPQPSDANLDAVIVGGGDHGLPKARVRDTQVTFKGRLCPAQTLKRDIVLVVDTSFSMSVNDPRAVDQCARLAATKALIASLPPDARFGIVTFNSGLATYSTGLYLDQAQLFKDLSRSRTLADVLCAAEGGTNYNAALGQAAQILQKGRAQATKEIYFLSDGQPDPGNDGVARAQDLKGSGVKIGETAVPATIATVMLAGEDTVLASNIASKDPAGKPLHAFAADTTELSSILTRLAANDIAAAELRVRAIGDTDFQTYDILGESTDLDFVVPSITIDGDKTSQGVEVVYSYRDKRGHEFSTGGKLTWQESSLGNKLTEGVSSLP